MTRRPLFTTEPLPVPVGYIPMAKAAMCLSCSSIFYIGPDCPNCASEEFVTLARFMDRQTDGRYCRACGRALSQRPEERERHFKQRLTCNTLCRDRYRKDMAREIWGIAKRFWSQVVKTDTCWLWTGSVSDTGYGSIRAVGRTWHTHRLSAALAGMRVGPGYEICHRCDVRHCVRPDHFFVGTRADNVADMLRKGRGHHQLARSTEAKP